MKDNILNEDGTNKALAELSSAILDIIFLYFLAFSSLGEKIEYYSKSLNLSEIESIIIFLLISLTMIAVTKLLLLSSIDFAVEKKNNKNKAKLIIKQLKRSFVLLIYSIFVLLILYELTILTGQIWWIYVLIVLIFLNLLTGLILPEIIFFRLNKMKRLNDDFVFEVKSKISKVTGIEIEGIYKYEIKNNINKPNAAVVGVGKMKRIILSGNILETFSSKEMEAVILHEAAHIKKKHVLKSMILMFGFLIITLSLTGGVLVKISNRFINIFSIVFYITIIQNISFIVVNWYSRNNEFEADYYSWEIMNTKTYIISALEKLHGKESDEIKTNFIAENMINSHPSIQKRIERLNLL